MSASHRLERMTQNDMDMTISDLDPGLEQQEPLQVARGTLSGVVLGTLLWLAFAAFWWAVGMELTQ